MIFSEVYLPSPRGILDPGVETIRIVCRWTENYFRSYIWKPLKRLRPIVQRCYHETRGFTMNLSLDRCPSIEKRHAKATTGNIQPLRTWDPKGFQFQEPLSSWANDHGQDGYFEGSALL